ncbi:unannotated protein [freshwater metagenome]|uniref:Unannotated protein n=1 Tax=freshwater metagenome TaxID=449393 RepID=A0A6J5YIN8_9ZZZZ
MTEPSKSARTAHSAMSSSGSARLDGTGSPAWSEWMASCELEKPMAPCSIDLRTSNAIDAISSAVAARWVASCPMTCRRMAQCPT